MWLTFRQTIEAVIAGREAAGVFFGGVFNVQVPDLFIAAVHTVVLPLLVLEELPGFQCLPPLAKLAQAADV